MKIITQDLLDNLVGREKLPTITPSQEKAFRRIEVWVRVRERSTKECFERLQKEEFSEADAQHAVDRACACGLISNKRYADALVRTRYNQGKGLSSIQRELADLHMTLEDVEGWDEGPFGCKREDEVVRALRLLEKKPIRAKNKQESAYRRILAKGFEPGVARQAVSLFFA